MTKKDYVAIANVLNNIMNATADDEDRFVICAIAQGIATVMANDAPKFNRQRFLSACGVNS